MQVQNNTRWPWKTIQWAPNVLCSLPALKSQAVLSALASSLRWTINNHPIGYRDEETEVFCRPYQEWEGFSSRGSALKPESNGQDEIWPGADWQTTDLWISSDNSDSHALCNMSNPIAVQAVTAYIRVTRLLNSAAVFSFYHRKQHRMDFTDRKNRYL